MDRQIYIFLSLFVLCSKLMDRQIYIFLSLFVLCSYSLTRFRLMSYPPKRGFYDQSYATAFQPVCIQCCLLYPIHPVTNYCGFSIAVYGEHSCVHDDQQWYKIDCEGWLSDIHVFVMSYACTVISGIILRSSGGYVYLLPVIIKFSGRQEMFQIEGEF